MTAVTNLRRCVTFIRYGRRIIQSDAEGIATQAPIDLDRKQIFRLGRADLFVRDSAIVVGAREFNFEVSWDA